VSPFGFAEILAALPEWKSSREEFGSLFTSCVPEFCTYECSNFR